MRSCPDSPTGPFSRSPISHRLHGSPDTLPTTYKTTHRASSTVCFAIRILTTANAANEDWKLLLSFFPPNWKELGQVTEALKGLRQDKSEENYMRTLLLHLGCGFSMRETVVRARQAKLAELSDVALLKRLRKSKDWLYRLCCALFEERGLVTESVSLP